jgi:hypothetical protein
MSRYIKALANGRGYGIRWQAVIRSAKSTQRAVIHRYFAG